MYGAENVEFKFPRLRRHLNSSYDKIGLNLKFEQAFVSVLENILGPSAVNIIIKTVPHVIIITHNGVRMAEWSKADRFECLVIREH